MTDQWFKFDKNGQAYYDVDDYDSDSDDDFEYDYDPPAAVQQVINEGKSLFHSKEFSVKLHNTMRFRDDLYDKTASSVEVERIEFPRDYGNLSAPFGFRMAQNQVQQPTISRSVTDRDSNDQEVFLTRNLLRSNAVDIQPRPMEPGFTIAPFDPSMIQQMSQNVKPVQGSTVAAAPAPVQQQPTVTSEEVKLREIFDAFVVKYKKKAKKFGDLRFFNGQDDKIKDVIDGLPPTTDISGKYHGAIDSIGTLVQYQAFVPTIVGILQNIRPPKYQEVRNLKFVYVGEKYLDKISTKLFFKEFLTFDEILSKNKDIMKEVTNMFTDYHFLSLNPSAKDRNAIFCQLALSRYLREERFIVLPDRNFVPDYLRFRLNEVNLLPFYFPSNGEYDELQQFCSMMKDKSVPRFIVNFKSFRFIVYSFFKGSGFSVPKARGKVKLTANSDVFTFINIH